MATPAPRAAPTGFAAINFRSPITWVVIIGGGITVYFLYQHFRGSSSSSTSANASGATPYPPTNTYVIEEGPEQEEPPATTPTKPGGQVGPNNIKKPKTVSYATMVKDAKAAHVSIRHEWEQLLSEGYTIIDVPKGVTPPAPDSTEPGGYLGPPDTMPKGGGIPNYVHTPTWPYGGQMVRPRLG